uniref:DNA/RNA-binding protein Kin17 WH-like domain-containing protein n=1 Tax=Hyaloperonospora arabidopsidis (strain Emoy2) TaxID=559515 RepID=M4BWP2_HYAAE
MGKHDFLTPKAIGIRMKAKGLQKLRWFCQVCQKQCRDENGFKCHTTSEAHQRQMLIVANDPDKFMSGYSELFEDAFLENLRRRHGTKRMRATHVYNEYIADKLHVHMNATQWETLGSFVQYLGRTGKCVVDETEKGWHIQYIDRDPKAIARQEDLEKKKKADLDHEERNRLFIQRQIKISSEKDGVETTQRPTKLQRGENGETIKISLLAAKKERGMKDSGLSDAGEALAFGGIASANVFGNADVKETEKKRENWKMEVVGEKRSGKQYAVDSIMEEEERRRRGKSRRLEEESKRQRKENWVTAGIVVKVTNTKVGDGRYHKCKGVVKDVEDKFCATVEMLDSGDVLRLDQDDLETVIPKLGRIVKVVNGLGRGCTAKLLAISVNDFCARIRIDSGPHRGETLDRVEYEDICRLADE